MYRAATMKRSVLLMAKKSNEAVDVKAKASLDLNVSNFKVPFMDFNKRQKD